jgi:hypothetical protein
MTLARNPPGARAVGLADRKVRKQTETVMASQKKPGRDEILALEKSYWDAMKAKDGGRTAALSGEASIVSGMRGVMSIPRDKMGEMTEAGDWTLESYEFEDIQFAAPTPDVAIIAYTVRQTVTMKGEPRDMRAADSSTWVRGPDGWKCHAHSETVLAG